MWTYEESLRVAREQSAVDMNCAPGDVLAARSKGVHSMPHPGARRYLALPFSCNLVSYGNHIVASVSPEAEPVVRAYIDAYPAEHCFETPDLQPPFVASIVSGGNTMLVHVRAWGDYVLLGATIDDAVGEAFDKVAKALGLGYPGGPAVSRAAQTGDSKAYPLPTPHVEGPYNVSFSGLKTAVLNLVNKAQMKGERVNVADMAASFQFRITDILAEKLLLAAQDTGAKQICIAGGVAANGLLRETLAAGAKKLGARLNLPELQLCGDNAAMVAYASWLIAREGWQHDLRMETIPRGKAIPDDMFFREL